MGHFYSKSKSWSSNHFFNHRNSTVMGIKIEKIKVKIENKATQIDERSPSVLKYKTPHFKYINVS